MAKEVEVMVLVRTIIKKLRKLRHYESGEYTDIADYRVKYSSENKEITIELQSGEYAKLAFGGGDLDSRWKPLLEMVNKDLDEELEEPMLGVIIDGKTYPVVKK